MTGNSSTRVVTVTAVGAAVDVVVVLDRVGSHTLNRQNVGLVSGADSAPIS